MCETGASISIYPGEGAESMTMEVPRSCDDNLIWLVGCFDREEGLKHFDFKNKTLSVRGHRHFVPPIDEYC